MRGNRKERSSQNEMTQEFFAQNLDEYLSNYDVKRALSHEDLKRLVRTLSHYAGSFRSTLEIGCGTGQLLAYLAANNPCAQFVGIDVNKSMITEARSKVKNTDLENCELIVADGEKLPLKEGMFRLVLLMQMLHHAKDIDVLASEVRKVVAYRGLLVVASCSHDQIRSSIDIANFPGVLKNEMRRVPDLMAIKNLLEKKGFRLKACVEFASSRRFSSCKYLTAWIRSIPFSTYAILPKPVFNNGLAICEKRLKKKYGNAEIVYLFCETLLFFHT